MPSERRLHPLSILFNVGKHLGALAIPLLLVVIGRGTMDDQWAVIALVLGIPYAAVAIGRYLTFRYRYEETELVIRHGLLFRNQRHIPYSRIQNIDAVQHVLHRLAGVVEVRLQTGGGSEPEATLSVLAVADLDDMRGRVFKGRRPPPVDATTPEAPRPAESSQQLLRLPLRELAAYGLVENHGMIVIGAALGLLSEFAPQDLVERWLGQNASGGLFRSVGQAVFSHGRLSWTGIAIGAFAIAGFLIVSRLFSIGWAFVRLNGYRLSRVGDDIRAEYGLLTRVVATVPRRRIQSITIRQSVLHRLCGRASVRVATAGGKAEHEEKVAAQREWLAPIIPFADVGALIAELLPGVDLKSLEWRPVHPRALRRAFIRRLVGAAPIVIAAGLLFGGPGWWLAPVLVVRAAIAAKLYVRQVAWSLTGDAVVFREGILGRLTTIAPLVRVQVVELHESPFDRRALMARVRVDTAGGSTGHGVDVPYLPRDVAHDLYAALSAAASQTAFQW